MSNRVFKWPVEKDCSIIVEQLGKSCVFLDNTEYLDSFQSSFGALVAMVEDLC